MRFFNRALVCWISPDRFQAAGELVKVFTSTYWIWIGRNTVLPDTHLDLAHTFKGQVPATLKFRGDESVLWIGRIVLPPRTLGSIAGSLKIALQGFEDVVPLPDTLFAGQHGSFDRCGLDHAEYLSADSFIYRDAAERDTARFAVIEPAANAEE